MGGCGDDVMPGEEKTVPGEPEMEPDMWLDCDAPARSLGGRRSSARLEARDHSVTVVRTNAEVHASVSINPTKSARKIKHAL